MIIIHVHAGFCDYPTYFDSVSGECVLTCPAGTIGNVSRATNVTMRKCTSRELTNSVTCVKIFIIMHASM